ncbi:MAG: APC family permease, partial [Pyrinomonadaceae bacterium]
NTHPVFRTPHISIIVTSLIMLVLTLSGTFVYAVTISAIARLLAYGTTCAAMLVFRRREQKNPALFKAPFGVLMSIASLILAGWLLSNSSLGEAVSASLAIIIGLIIYYSYRIIKRRRVNDE